MPRYVFTLVGEPDHYDRWDAATDEEQQLVLDHYASFARAVGERGRLVAGEALGRPSAGFTVRRDQQAATRAATDGPFAETAEQLCGFYLADLPGEVDAREVALLLPSVYSIEVRLCPDVGVTPR